MFLKFLSSFIDDLPSLLHFAIAIGKNGLTQKLFYFIDPALAKCRTQTLGHHSVVTAEGQGEFPCHRRRAGSQGQFCFQGLWFLGV